MHQQKTQFVRKFYLTTQAIFLSLVSVVVLILLWMVMKNLLSSGLAPDFSEFFLLYVSPVLLLFALFVYTFVIIWKKKQLSRWLVTINITGKLLVTLIISFLTATLLFGYGMAPTPTSAFLRLLPKLIAAAWGIFIVLTLINIFILIKFRNKLTN